MIIRLKKLPKSEQIMAKLLRVMLKDQRKIPDPSTLPFNLPPKSMYHCNKALLSFQLYRKD